MAKFTESFELLFKKLGITDETLTSALSDFEQINRKLTIVLSDFERKALAANRKENRSYIIYVMGIIRDNQNSACLDVVSNDVRPVFQSSGKFDQLLYDTKNKPFYDSAISLKATCKKYDEKLLKLGTALKSSIEQFGGENA